MNLICSKIEVWIEEQDIKGNAKSVYSDVDRGNLHRQGQKASIDATKVYERIKRD